MRRRADSLVLNKISKEYGAERRKLKVLEDITFSARPGSFVCLIGPNGSGKTSLVKIISGIDRSYSGNLTAPSRVSYLPQQGSLMPWLSVTENLKLPARIIKASPAALDKKIDYYLKKFNLYEFQNFYPEQLSGGMQQKVALIKIALYDPDIMVLDEPFSALDAITRLRMQQWLVELWQELSCSVVCVTHDIAEALYLADKIYVLGGKPAKIIHEYSVKINRPRDVDKFNAPAVIKEQKLLRELLVNEA